MLTRFAFAFAFLAVALTAVPGAGPAFAQEQRPVVVGMALEPPHLDPTAGAAAAIDEVTYANVFEGLTRIAADGSVEPALAASWETSADGMVFTFALREGVTFHDGSPFDASVARFSLDRARAEGAGNAQPQLFAAIDTVEATDPLTLTVRLSRPDGDFAAGLGWGDAVMVHPASAATNKERPVGTGPFAFERWRRGDRVVLARYDGYWGEPAALPRAEFAFLADPTAALAALLAGDVHAFPNFPAPEQLPLLQVDPRFTVVVGATEGEVVLAINARRPPLGRVGVRRAIAAAIDRQALIDGAMYGTGQPIGSHMTPHNPAYVDLTGASPYDPDRARALLAEAGVADLALTISVPPPTYARRSAEIVAAQLRAVGIAASLRPVEWSEWLARVFTEHDYDLSIVAHTEPGDINVYARPTYYFHVEDARLNGVIAALEAAGDAAERTALLQEAQRIVAALQVNAFLFVLPKLGVWDARLAGFWTDAPVQANDLTRVRWTK